VLESKTTKSSLKETKMEANKASHLIIAFSHPGTDRVGSEMARVLKNITKNTDFNPSSDCRIEVRTLPQNASDPDNYDIAYALLMAWVREQGVESEADFEAVNMSSAGILAQNAKYKFIQCTWVIPLNNQIAQKLEASPSKSIKLSQIPFNLASDRTIPPNPPKKWWEFWKK
jgi:hypothetical protein